MREFEIRPTCRSIPGNVRLRFQDHVVGLIVTLNDVRTGESGTDFGAESGVVKSRGHGAEQLWKFVFQRRERAHVCACLSRVFHHREQQKRTPVFSCFERRRGMKPLEPADTLVDVFSCTRGCVPCSAILSLAPRLREVGRSCERMDTKGYGGGA